MPAERNVTLTIPATGVPQVTEINCIVSVKKNTGNFESYSVSSGCTVVVPPDIDWKTLLDDKVSEVAAFVEGKLASLAHKKGK